MDDDTARRVDALIASQIEFAEKLHVQSLQAQHVGPWWVRVVLMATAVGATALLTKLLIS